MDLQSCISNLHMTVIFCEVNEEVRNVKAILWCFEAVSGLKVNFFKSEVVGVGVGEERVMLLADIMWCKWVISRRLTWACL